MTRKIDWAKAADLQPEELDRMLAGDADEVDEGAEASDGEIEQVRPGRRRPGQRGPGKTPAKVLMTLRVEPDILEAWRATGTGWQGRVNEVLKREARKLAKTGT